MIEDGHGWSHLVSVPKRVHLFLGYCRKPINSTTFMTRCLYVVHLERSKSPLTCYSWEVNSMGKPVLKRHVFTLLNTVLTIIDAKTSLCLLEQNVQETWPIRATLSGGYTTSQNNTCTSMHVCRPCKKLIKLIIPYHRLWIRLHFVLFYSFSRAFRLHCRKLQKPRSHIGWITRALPRELSQVNSMGIQS